MTTHLRILVCAGAALLAAGTLNAQGAATAPVPREQPAEPDQGAVRIPPEVAGFRMMGRHDYEDPSMGTTVRYGRDDDDLHVDIYVYPGVEVNAACDAVCAVKAEADGFIGDFPGLVRAGHYERLDLTADEPLQPPAGAPWAYGRHLSMSVRRRGQELESQYWVFSMPGFFLKARSSYPASPEARARVQRFADELPGALMPSRD